MAHRCCGSVKGVVPGFDDNAAVNEITWPESQSRISKACFELDRACCLVDLVVDEMIEPSSSGVTPSCASAMTGRCALAGFRPACATEAAEAVKMTEIGCSCVRTTIGVLSFACTILPMSICLMPTRPGDRREQCSCTQAVFGQNGFAPHRSEFGRASGRPRHVADRGLAAS